MGKILIVDDEAGILASLEKVLAGGGHRMAKASRADQAFAMLDSEQPDLVIMDIRMPGMSGLDAFRRIRGSHPKLPVIIMTGYGTTESAIEATKIGAFDYLVKPFDPGEMLKIVNQGLECVRLMQRQVGLARTVDAPAGDTLIGDSAQMNEVYKAIGRVAETDVTVLVRGETGTGKELVARAIYQHSRRRDAPLLFVNCAAIPETLLESELFGYEKGAFTGAGARRIGKFEQARGGKILLDEIGDIPPGTQAKILRVLQEKTFERVGGHETIESDVRIVAATNRNLERAISEGRFREDLYHRLNVVTIQIPSLRERREDIPLLTDYFLARFAPTLGIERPALTAEALAILRAYAWPGNVRELEHCIHRAMIFTRGYPIQQTDIVRALERAADGPPETGAGAGKDDAGDTERFREQARDYLARHSGDSVHMRFLEMADKALIMEALLLSEGNQTRAAKLLGLTRPTLQAKMQKHGLRRTTEIRGD